MLLLYHQKSREENCEKYTKYFSSVPSVFSYAKAAAPAKRQRQKENAGTGMHPVRMILSSPLCHNHREKQNIIFGQKDNSKTSPLRATIASVVRLAPGRPLRNAEIKGEGTMEQLFLMPGEERCERFKDGNGIPRVHYSYRSMHGAFFDCESRSLEEAQRCVRTGW